jgi:hypothetical protein
MSGEGIPVFVSAGVVAELGGPLGEATVPLVIVEIVAFMMVTEAVFPLGVAVLVIATVAVATLSVGIIGFARSHSRIRSSSTSCAAARSCGGFALMRSRATLRVRASSSRTSTSSI